MSDQGQTTFDEIATGVSTIVNLMAPIVSMAFPGAAIAVSIGQKIIQGALNAEPEAVGLYKQIMDNELPTAEQLKQYQTNYEAAYQQLNADINAKLATLPND